MARHKDSNWQLGKDGDDGLTWTQVSVAVLMDIRDEMKAVRLELQTLNRVFSCPNFQAIPHILKGIRRKFPARKKAEV